MAAKGGCFGLSKVTGDLAKVESRINGQRGEWRGTGVGCGFRCGDQGRLPREACRRSASGVSGEKLREGGRETHHVWPRTCPTRRGRAARPRPHFPRYASQPA